MIGYSSLERLRRLGRSSANLVVSVGLCAGVGCRHHAVKPLVLPAQTPVAIAPLPGVPPLLAEAPRANLPPVPVLVEEPKPKRSRRRSKPAQVMSTPPAAAEGNADPGPPTATVGAVRSDGSAGQPPEMPNAAPLTSSEIGVFTVGGEQNPRSKRDAAELIANNDRRLVGLPIEVMRVQAALVSKVRTFQRDAQQALGSGDAEGAKTLATKGKLLLDDLDRGVPSQ